VLFVDISGSSRLYQRLGDSAAHRCVRTCLGMLRDVVETRGGRVVKHIGDGLMCEFADADAALLSAEAMQVAVEDDANGRDPRLGIHIGCHFGPVIDTGGDLFGDTVNVAARVLDMAREDQIVITQDTAERLSESLQRNVRLLHGVSVKGRRDPLHTLDYIWRKQGEPTIQAPAAAPALARLKLRFGGRELWLDRTGLSSINLGRSAECHVIVLDPEASRLHATIEARGDRFVLVDRSSNGTYVAWDGVAEVRLKREELILPARGRIALGLSTSEAQATLVEFSRETRS
jgi:class 3 adenylate cyclase